MKIYKLLALAVVSLGFVACSNEEDGPGKKNPPAFQPISLTPAEYTVAASSSRFAWDLFSEVNALSKPNENINISPISANIALAAFANGTKGEVQREIYDVLGYTTLDQSAVNKYLSRVCNMLETADPSTTVKFANSIWSAIPVKQSFINRLAESYDIEVFNLNRSTAMSDINNWCNEKTNGMIPSFLKSAPDFDFALLNTVYFKGFWRSNNKFDKKNTHKDKFYNSDGTTSKVDFMKQTATVSTAWTEKTAMCELNFGNCAYKLRLVLPDEGVTIEEAIEELQKGMDAAVDGGLRDMTMTVPKFEVNTDSHLVDALKSLGINQLFDNPSADFSEITDMPLVINAVRQSTKFRIDEDGAEAAAVTSVSGCGSPGPIMKGEIVFNRPFIYLIYGQPSGNILFMGCVRKL